MFIGFSLQQSCHPFLFLIFHDSLHLMLSISDFIYLLLWHNISLNIINLSFNLWIFHLKVFVASCKAHHVIGHFIVFG